MFILSVSKQKVTKPCVALPQRKLIKYAESGISEILRDYGCSVSEIVVSQRAQPNVLFCFLLCPT